MDGTTEAKIKQHLPVKKKLAICAITKNDLDK